MRRRSVAARLVNSAAIRSILFSRSEVGVFFDTSDLTTLFQDSAGTTPVTSPSQPVGLMLDKSQGLTLGPELVTNGTFDSGTTRWVATNSIISVVSGELEVTATASPGATATQVMTGLTVGRTYSVGALFRAAAGNSVANSARFSILDPGVSYISQNVVSGNGVPKLLKCVFVATKTTLTVALEIASSSTWGAIGDKAYFDNISVKALPGYHATQSTTGNRPIYAVMPQFVRKNLLTYTEQFDNAAWAKSNATVTADTTAAPNGTITADTILDNAVSNIHYLAQDITSLAPSGKTYTVSAYAKAGTLNFATLGLSDISSGSLYAVVVFNLSTGSVATSGAAGTGYSVVSSSISSAGNGWYRCIVTVSVGTSASFLRSVVAPNKTGVITSSAGGFESYLGNGSGFYLWGAQLEIGSTATPYQSITRGLPIRNLLTYTSFEGAVAGTPGTFPTSFPSNATTGSIVSVSGGTIVFSANGGREIGGAAQSVAANTTETWSIYITENSGLQFNQLFAAINTTGSTVSGYANGVLVNTTTYVPVAGDRLSLVLVNGATAITPIFRIGVGASGTATGQAGFKNPQRELGSAATTYQKVVTQYEVTEAGVATLPYLSFTPNADKVQVFAGVRKLSDAAATMVAELSSAVGSNAGTFLISAPNSAATNYGFNSRGTTLNAAVVASPYTAPVTNVLTGIGDISGSNATLRVNGSQAAQSLLSQGTGNFLAYPLYIGARAGTSLFFNGNLYGLIVRFAAANLDATTITKIERFTNSKTGAY